MVNGIRKKKDVRSAVRGLGKPAKEKSMSKEEMIEKTADNLRVLYYEDLEFVYKMVEGLIQKKYRLR